jgi:MFS family permease
MASQTDGAGHLLGIAVAVTLGAQALVVLASLTLPVAAVVVLPQLGLGAHVVGWYASAIFLAGAVSTLLTPPLVARYGAVRVHQAMLALAAGGLAALAAGLGPGLIASALLIGLAYGPANPASSSLLARLAPPHLRNRVFSLKQVAVPLGGAAAGLLVPGLAELAGWQVAALGLAAVLGFAALLIQPWRAPLDAGAAGTGGPPAGLLAPFALLRQGGPALRLGATALCFGAVQFSFSAFLPTVLVRRPAGASPRRASR